MLVEQGRGRGSVNGVLALVYGAFNKGVREALRDFFAKVKVYGDFLP